MKKVNLQTMMDDQTEFCDLNKINIGNVMAAIKSISVSKNITITLNKYKIPLSGYGSMLTVILNYLNYSDDFAYNDYNYENYDIIIKKTIYC